MKKYLKSLLGCCIVICGVNVGYRLISFTFKFGYYSKTISRDGLIVTRSIKLDGSLKKKDQIKEEEMAKNELDKVRRI